MSKVTHKPTGRTLRYGELAADAAKIKLDKEPAIKTPDQFKFIGKPMPRLDTPLKINGSAKFGIDIEVPGMVHAAIMACPVSGGTAQKRGRIAIAGRRGVIAGGQAPTMPWRWLPTATGAPRLRSTSCDRVGCRRRRRVPTARSSQGRTVTRSSQRGSCARNDGNVDAAMPGAAKMFEASYEVPIIAHAPMEPMNCHRPMCRPTASTYGSVRRTPTLALAAARDGFRR